MFMINDILLSDDVLSEYFACDINQCKGACCANGDAGAPVKQSEIEQIQAEITKIKVYLTQESKEFIQANNFSYEDESIFRIKSLANNQCVFAIIENGIYKCGIEKAHSENNSTLKKPISCALYPIRITEYPEFTAVNLHRWKICEAAFCTGKDQKIKAHEFCKESLIKYFGESFYEKLEQLEESR